MTPLQKFRALLDEYAGTQRMLRFKRFVWGQKPTNVCKRLVIQTKSKRAILSSFKGNGSVSYMDYPKGKHITEHSDRCFFVLNDIIPGEVLVYDFSWF